MKQLIIPNLIIDGIPYVKQADVEQFIKDTNEINIKLQNELVLVEQIKINANDELKDFVGWIKRIYDFEIPLNIFNSWAIAKTEIEINKYGGLH